MSKTKILFARVQAKLDLVLGTLLLFMLVVIFAGFFGTTMEKVFHVQNAGAIAGWSAIVIFGMGIVDLMLSLDNRKLYLDIVKRISGK